jgi:hypothetical protein
MNLRRGGSEQAMAGITAIIDNHASVEACQAPPASCKMRTVGPAERGTAVLCELHLSGEELEDAPRGGEGRMASGRALSPCRLHRHQYGETGRMRH